MIKQMSFPDVNVHTAFSLLLDTHYCHVTFAIEFCKLCFAIVLCKRCFAKRVLQIVIRNGADGILFGASKSPELVNWTSATYRGRVNNGDGATSTVSFRGSEPAPSDREFMRFDLAELP